MTNTVKFLYIIPAYAYVNYGQWSEEVLLASHLGQYHNSMFLSSTIIYK